MYSVILLLTFFSLYVNDKYEISFDKFLSEDISFYLDIYNIVDNGNLFYSGSIENIQDSLNINNTNKREKKVTLKEGDHPLVYIMDNYNVNYINLFPTSTFFIILKDYIKYLKDVNKKYNIFTLNNYYENDFLLYNDYFNNNIFIM